MLESIKMLHCGPCFELVVCCAQCCLSNAKFVEESVIFCMKMAIFPRAAPAAGRLKRAAGLPSVAGRAGLAALGPRAGCARRGVHYR